MGGNAGLHMGPRAWSPQTPQQWKFSGLGASDLWWFFQNTFVVLCWGALGQPLSLSECQFLLSRNGDENFTVRMPGLAGGGARWQKQLSLSS